MEILAMETTTEKCFLKIAVLNFQNIKKIIYNFSNIFSFPCTLLVMKTFLYILLLYCVFLLTTLWPHWHPYNKSLKVSQQGKELFCILEWGSVKCVTRDKISRSGGGTKKEGEGGGEGKPTFFEKIEGRNLPRRTLWLGIFKVAFLIECMIFLSSFQDVTRLSMSTVSFLAQLDSRIPSL